MTLSDPSTVQFYVDDTSPAVSYYPFADTLTIPNLQAGWNPYYSLSGFATAAASVSGNGTSSHITALNGASLTLSFNGTGIQLIGNATNASYSLTLDGSLAQPNSSLRADNILASFQGLPNAPHSLLLTTITSPTSSFIAFDKALITAPPLNQNVSIASTFPTQVYPDDSIAFLGKWSFQKNYTNTNTSFHQSTTAGDRAHLSFIGTSLFLTGLTSPDCGQYSVTIDNDTATTQTHSARSSFILPDALLFFASGLDPKISHDLTVENLDGNVLALKLDGVEVVTQGPASALPNSTWCPEPNPDAGRHSGTYPRGTIAALVLGGVFVVSILATTLFYFMNWRTRKLCRWRGNRVMKTNLARDGLVLDICSGGAAVALGSVHSPTALDIDAKKPEVHDLSNLSPIVAIAGSVKSEAKSSNGWMGQVSSRSRSRENSKCKCKCKGKCKGNGPSQSQNSSSGTGTSFTIDLQLTPPRRSSQVLPRSRSGSRSADLPSPPSPPSLSKFPDPPNTKAGDKAAPGTQPGISDTHHDHSGSSRHSPAPLIPSRPSSPTPPPHKHHSHEQKRSSRSLLHLGLPNLEPPGSENSSIEYLDVAPDPAGGDYVNECEVDGITGLSPRTSVAGQKTQPALAVGPFLVNIPEQESEELKRVQEAPTKAAPGEGQGVSERAFLNTVDTSPFQVDFEGRLHSSSGKSGSSHVRFQEDLEEFGQRPRGPVPQISREPSLVPERASTVISFLDFGATSSSSLLTESSSSNPQPIPGVSRWSSTTLPSTFGSHDPHLASSTASFPFPVSMSSTQNRHSNLSNQRRASQNQPQQGSPHMRQQLLLPVGRHPQSDLDAAPSPTESIPMSVSDILFRQSVSDDESRRASTGSHLLRPHPPLPGLPSAGESDQSRGSSPGALGRASDPLASSSFIVQRVLGVSVGSPISHDHVRSGSTSHSETGPR